MGESVDEIVVIPSAFLDAMADGNFVGVGSLEDISGEAVDEGSVSGSIVLAGTAQVLAQIHVEHPVQAILDLPMGSGELECLLRRQQCGGHEQTRHWLGLIAPAGDADEGPVAGHQRLPTRHDLCLPP